MKMIISAVDSHLVAEYQRKIEVALRRGVLIFLSLRSTEVAHNKFIRCYYVSNSLCAIACALVFVLHSLVIESIRTLTCSFSCFIVLMCTNANDNFIPGTHFIWC